MKLALGTAQFGLPYGIANHSGQVAAGEVAAIVRRAWSAGVRTLDTAIAYGDSERRLGAAGVAGWDVVTKLPAVDEDCRDVDGWVLTAVEASLERLQVPRLYGLLLHRPQQLLADPRLYRALQAVKRHGLVQKVGISIYDTSELDLLVPRFHFDLVQAPFNLVDARMLQSGWLARLANEQVELHVRSVFLQGLLLMSRADRPQQFGRWAPLLSAYDAWLAASGTTAVAACLRYVLGFAEISRVIVGVDSLAHLAQVLDASSGTAPSVPEWLQSGDVDLLNPARWASL
jgi:aryl-alcohol dehydrogenase-like predicted oxidoreductase